MSVRPLTAVRGEAALKAMNDKATCMGYAVAFSFFGSDGERIEFAGVETRVWRDVMLPGWDVAHDCYAYASAWNNEIRAETFLTVKRPSLFLPEYAWVDGVWFDAPLVHLDGRGGVFCFAAEGTPVSYELKQAEAQSFDAAAFTEVRQESRMTSLVFAAQMLWNDLNEICCVDINDFSLETMIALVLFRKAFPELSIHVDAGIDYKLWPAQMKRLSQHLGFQLYEVEVPEDARRISLMPLMTSFSGYAEELLASVNKMSAVIPWKAEKA